ncbi:hypothetical protein HETIRDRAFT_421099 [Heterobasidion irregulare TC 32-1]|uniref:Uncharacterized protein n=1 Tax=Heterobasidion irregulare (strain TC 32-1) TaxID=747525 RepID=W4JZU6_HETIT|nr:uncharacterized protein HETIRDRAFT_421099 [Heterobasidion irregulare TC 32-1]ETW78366.1 hypothetical protein HETIRDRAFT_421099 [Heterobasidion irregulare TC 32-1]
MSQDSPMSAMLTSFPSLPFASGSKLVNQAEMPAIFQPAMLNLQNSRYSSSPTSNMPSNEFDWRCMQPLQDISYSTYVPLGQAIASASAQALVHCGNHAYTPLQLENVQLKHQMEGMQLLFLRLYPTISEPNQLNSSTLGSSAPSNQLHPLLRQNTPAPNMIKMRQHPQRSRRRSCVLICTSTAATVVWIGQCQGVGRRWLGN